MTVRVIVMPTGPKATHEGIEAWKASGQKAADEHHAEIELKSYNKDGSIAAHLIATPDEGESRLPPIVTTLFRSLRRR